ncbi:MAG: tail protein X [Azonexus sp.]|nr:tail protein X [Deltaproteobacteria bacterium]MDP3635775.1 tail protein X [Azonexus sp.]MDZ4313615.1 tail protein X [Azonexus sp.]
MQVRAQQGDTLDSLCWRHLGSSAAVEAALELNPGLAALGPILPNGQPVTLPDAAPIATAGKTLLQLWD